MRMKCMLLIIVFPLILATASRVLGSELPRFLLSDSEAEELLNDLFARHPRLDVSELSLRGQGVSYPGERLTLWSDWEVTRLHWFDVSRAGSPTTNRRNAFLQRMSGLPVDRFGYVWSGPLEYEDPMSDSRGSFGQGWCSPTYIDGGTGTEWNGDSLEGWRLKQCAGIEVKDGWLHFTSSGPLPELYSPVLDIEAERVAFIEMDFVLDEVIPPDPYIRWMRVGWNRRDDTRWSDRQQVELKDFSTVPPIGLRPTTRYRVWFPVYLHPGWKGVIHELRIAPFTYWGRAAGRFRYNYIRFGYDTRQAANNPTYITAAWRYYLWTGERGFLQRNLPNLRRALLFLNHHLRGKELLALDQSLFFRGHDAMGATAEGDPNPGHGIGSGYFDLLGLGSWDLAANLTYIRALEAMAEVEKLFPLTLPPRGKAPTVSSRDGRGEIVYDATAEGLAELAGRVRSRVRELFWNPATGRFAGGIDASGNRIDYGSTYLNLEALAMGLATPEEAKLIFDWLDGRRIVEGDTSTGDDIYFWQFAPRTTTRQNERHYVWTWVREMKNGDVRFGESVPDGGAALWGSYYDIVARVRYGYADSAWQRLKEILAWHWEVREKGGKGDQFYRVAYPSGDARGPNPEIVSPWDGMLHGGGTIGGLGLDAEFIENGLVPTSILFGFLGVDIPRPEAFRIHPRIPEGLEYMGATGILHGLDRLEVKAGRGWADLAGSVIRSPGWELRVRFDRLGDGQPSVLRDGTPFPSFRVLDDGSIEVTDTDKAPHRYEVRWTPRAGTDNEGKH